MSRGGGSRVYVGGLLDSVRKEDLEREFSKYGKLAHVWVAWNPPGFAFVEFDDERDAEEAVTSLNGQEICGSRVRVEMSKGGRGRGGRGGRGRGRGFGGRRGSFRDGGGRGMRGGRGRDRGGRSGGMFSRGSRSNKDRYGDFDMGSRGDRDRYGGRDQYDGGEYYSRPAMSSSFRSRSPIGGRRYMDTTPDRM